MKYQIISESRDVGTIKKVYHAIQNGSIVGRIVAEIRTQNGLKFSLAPKGYSVKVHVFHKGLQINSFSSYTFENQTLKEAMETRSNLIKLAKESMKSCEESYSL